MRLLIVNPNTSAGVTSRIDAAAQAVAMPGDRFVTVSAAFGPALIVTEPDAQEATKGVLAAISRHREPIDGIVLASFGDTGAAQVRAAWPDVPVMGIAEAAFADAAQIGGPFAIVTFAPEVTASLAARATMHGLGESLVRVAAPTEPLRHDPAEVADLLFGQLRALCDDCAGQGARSIVMGGGPLAGLASRIAPHCPVPVIDGTQSAVSRLRLGMVARSAV
ncbi:aspartate/glutamate racemase family protein [Roseicyclus sp.]|uniref:aspartate/glutamate racemase family protein n=1 Tax=Roseicyclus sp. TaxID=1914329 RepID=UPI003F6B04C3